MKNNLKNLNFINRQLLALVIFIMFGVFVNAQETIHEKKYLEPFQFYVSSDNPLFSTNKSATVTIEVEEIITFEAHPNEFSGISELVIWSMGTPSTFNGLGILLEDTNKLKYYAVSQTNPKLTDGVDTLLVTDGVNTITITIVISLEHTPVCDTTKPLLVNPGIDGTVRVSALSTFTFTGYGGTCNYAWALVENNSLGASLVRENSKSAIYTAGSKIPSVDIVEMYDGLSIKRIEVQVGFSDSNGSGNGCFIRNKRSQRD